MATLHICIYLLIPVSIMTLSYADINRMYRQCFARYAGTSKNCEVNCEVISCHEIQFAGSWCQSLRYATQIYTASVDCALLGMWGPAKTARSFLADIKNMKEKSWDFSINLHLIEQLLITCRGYMII